MVTSRNRGYLQYQRTTRQAYANARWRDRRDRTEVKFRYT